MYQLLRSLLYIYIYISLFNIRQLSIKTANEIHYCGTYTDPHYQPLPVQSSRYLLLSRNMPIIENEYFVAKNVRVLDESYLYFPCCKNHHTRLILLSSVLYSLYPFIDSHLSIVLFIHPANLPTHPHIHRRRSKIIHILHFEFLMVSLYSANNILCIKCCYSITCPCLWF